MAGISEMSSLYDGNSYEGTINYRTKVDKGFKIPKSAFNQYIFDDDGPEPPMPRSSMTDHDQSKWLDSFHKTKLDPAFKLGKQGVMTFSDKKILINDADIVEFMRYRDGQNIKPKLISEFGDEESYKEYMSGWLDENMTIDLDPMIMNKDFSDREKVSEADLKKAKDDGVVQKKPNGKWGIISIDAKEWWNADYDTKDNAKNALAAYHAQKHFSDFNNAEFNAEPTESIISDMPHLIGSLMFSVSYIHLYHLTTNSYARHKAFEDYYTDMPDKVDALAETWMANNQMVRFQNTIVPSDDSVNYLLVLKGLALNVRQDYEDVKYVNLCSLIDDIINLIDATLYKIKRLDSGNKIFSIKK